MKKNIIFIIFMISIAVIGCNSIKKDINISDAYKTLYDSNFSYIETCNFFDANGIPCTLAYNGEYSAEPNIKHLTVTEGTVLWDELYVYKENDQLKGIAKVNNVWQEAFVEATYFTGYENRENLEVTAITVETIDDKTYLVCDVKFVLPMKSLYKLDVKYNATITQKYYINSNTRRIERIVSDVTEEEKLHAIALDIMVNETTLEDALNNMERRNFKKSIDVQIEYLEDDFRLELPEINQSNSANQNR